MTRFAVCVLALSLAGDAYALDPYMWGLGPKLGTMVIPGSYPALLPPAVRSDTASGIARVKNDLSIGFDGVYYIKGRSRARAHGQIAFGLGSPYFDTNFNLGGQVVAIPGAMDILFGGSAGVGTASFGGEGDSKLVMPYYPLRVDASALVKDSTRGYQLTSYFVYNVPGKQKFTDIAGVESTPGWGVNFALGVELVLYFGDLEPPRRKKKPS